MQNINDFLIKTETTDSSGYIIKTTSTTTAGPGGCVAVLTEEEKKLVYFEKKTDCLVPELAVPTVTPAYIQKPKPSLSEVGINTVNKMCFCPQNTISTSCAQTQTAPLNSQSTMTTIETSTQTPHPSPPETTIQITPMKPGTATISLEPCKTTYKLSLHSKSVLESERGARGLPNIGNTCFLNSVIQCLSNTKPLLEYILNQEYLNEVQGSGCLLIMRFAELIQNIWNAQRGQLSTNSLKDTLGLYAPQFNGYNQHDAHELLRYLLEGLHGDINRAKNKTTAPDQSNTQPKNNDSMSAEEIWQSYKKNENSKIIDIFGGLLRSVLQCTCCGFVSTVFEPFLDLSLPIPNDSNSHIQHSRLHLNQCLDLFTNEETLDVSEWPICSNCKTKQKCVKKISIERFPHVLVIHLKRFSPVGMTHKIDSVVDFPLLELNMSAYSAEAQLKNTSYNLYGVISHYGSCHYGHYTAYCKNPFSGKWHRFNDRIVSQIDPETTDKADAYILFYEANV